MHHLGRNPDLVDMENTELVLSHELNNYSIFYHENVNLLILPHKCKNKLFPIHESISMQFFQCLNVHVSVKSCC